MRNCDDKLWVLQSLNITFIHIQTGPHLNGKEDLDELECHHKYSHSCGLNTFVSFTQLCFVFLTQSQSAE